MASSGFPTYCYDVAAHAYDALGDLHIPGVRPARAGRAQPWGSNASFSGKERDSETGLDYFGARYFSGAQGRFTSSDPFNIILQAQDRDEFNEYISNPQNWNRYVYTWNNPLQFVDPNGERVYIVAYTTGNDSGDDEYRKIAQTLGKEIENSKGFDKENDTVLVQGVKTKGDLKELLDFANSVENPFGKVEQLSIVSHAGPGDGPIFQHGTPQQDQYFDRGEIRGLHVNWSATASACLYSCRAGMGFAQEFADLQGVRTGAFDGFGRIVGYRNGTWPLNKGYLFRLNPGPLYMEGTRTPQLKWFNPRR
jgi:RHS repeat-associated protein